MGRGRDALATAGGTPALLLRGHDATRFNLRVAGYSEAVVGVVKFWGDAGAGGTAGDFDVMAPGASAGGLALAAGGASWIAGERGGVVIRVKPVAAPFVNVLANVLQADVVGKLSGDGS